MCLETHKNKKNKKSELHPKISGPFLEFKNKTFGMKNNRWSDGIREVKKTAHYTIPLIIVLSFILCFGKISFFFYMPFLMLVAFTTQFLFGFFSFDKVQLSKSKSLLIFVLFVGIAILSFTKLSV
jgi:hypothetical protein